MIKSENYFYRLASLLLFIARLQCLFDCRKIITITTWKTALSYYCQKKSLSEQGHSTEDVRETSYMS